VSGGFSPLDQQLALRHHAWSAELIDQALQLDVLIASCRRAARVFETMIKVPLSKSTLHRLSLEYGGQLAEQEAAEAERLSAPGSVDEGIATWQEQPEPDAEIMAISLDGVMVNMREEGWKEIRLGAISAVECEPGAAGEPPTVHLTRHSYRAGLWDVETFARQQWLEACRRGLEKARCVVAVADAAAWIWRIILTCYAPCIEVIDWWHALQRLWTIAHTTLGEDNPLAAIWVERLKTLLWHGQMRALFQEVRRHWPRGKERPDALRLALGYLFRQRARMHYADFRAQGYPTGSGTVESGCKTVVQGRCCQSGMRWGREGLQAILSLRCALLSERWQEVRALL